MRYIATLLFVAATAASAAVPQSGVWWSPSESGRGYAIDVQDDTLVMTTFAYAADGRMQWYYSDGKLSGDGTVWSGALLKFDQGQPLNGVYRAPAAQGNDGTVSIRFTTRTTGVMTLPGGRTVNIERQNFGVGGPPRSILGSWLYAYAVGNDTFAARFDYTTVGAATATGTGVVVDSVAHGAAEYMASGEYAGQVVAIQFDGAGNPQSTYLWNQYMEEGRGFWIQPNTQIPYGMNVYRFAGPSRIPKAAGAESKGTPIEEYSARNPALGAIARAFWKEISGARPY